MTVYCAAIDCKYNGDKNRCTAKSINLTDSYYHTVNEGFKHFNICKNYEKSEIEKQIEEIFKEYINEHNH